MDPEEAWALPQPPGCVTHTVPTTGTPHLPAAAAQAGLQPPSPPLPFAPPLTAVGASPPAKPASGDADPGALKTHRGANRCINTA